MSARLLGIGFACDMGTPHRKLVLLKLIDACEDDGTRIFPAVATIARAAQCSPRQVQRELARMVEVGLLAIIREGGKGPRSTREYALDVAMLRRIEADGWTAMCCEAGSGSKGDTVSPLEDEGKGDSGDTERVTAATQKGDRLSHPTPPEPSTDPSAEREGARERGQGGQPETLAPAETPGRADFQKRVMRFCTGRGYLAGVWKDWDVGASFDWIAGQFAALSAEERADAERWRDAYLLDVADRRVGPIGVGNFLKGRIWLGLEPALMERLERRRQAQLAPEDRSKPEGWAACLGPVGMARLFAILLDGPTTGDLHPGRMWFETQMRSDWPAVHQWKQVLLSKGGVVFGARWHALKAAMEPVPAGTEVLAAWKAEFSARGWPWLSAFDGAPVVYCPVGGPDGLETFEAALREGGETREAAE